MDIIFMFLEWIIDAFAFCLLSIWCKELIQLATGLWLAPKFNFKLNRFTLFHLNYTKEDGQWICTKGKRSPLIQSLITIDLDKYTTSEEMERKEKQLEALRVAILFVVSAAVTLVCLPFIRNVMAGEHSILDSFLTAFCTGLCFHSFTTLCIRLYVYGVMMKKLPGYVQTLGNRLRSGESFTTMQLLPVEQLNYQNPKPMEKLFYYYYYLPVMLMQGNIDAMRNPIREMTSYLRDKDYLIPETLGYYWLVFYYSRYDLNPSAASHFLNKIRTTIEQDRDANAKRVLAYYAFGIEQDFAKARRYTDEAYAALSKLKSKAEWELENMLLNELSGFLRQKGF